jgi:hypothetical protein
MSPQQLGLWTLALIGTIAATGCHCEGEQQNVVVSSPAGLTLTADGVERHLTVPVTRLTEFHITRPAFRFLYNTLEGSNNGEGVAFGVTGTDPVTNDVVALSIALPVSFRVGDEYPIVSTYPVEATLNTDIRSWGAHDLQFSNKAEVAFTTAVYTFPPPVYTPNYRAATTSGTIRVVDRQRGRVELSLNLTFADDTGKTKALRGNVVTNTGTVDTGCA